MWIEVTGQNGKQRGLFNAEAVDYVREASEDDKTFWKDDDTHGAVLRFRSGALMRVDQDFETVARWLRMGPIAYAEEREGNRRRRGPNDG